MKQKLCRIPRNLLVLVILIVGVAFCIATMAIGISYAGEGAKVYKDVPCYIGGVTVNQDCTCEHGYYASDSQVVETPSGEVVMTCHFDPDDIPDYCHVDELYMHKNFGCWITYYNDEGEKVSIYTFNSQFVKTPAGQAMLRIKGKLP